MTTEKAAPDAAKLQAKEDAFEARFTRMAEKRLAALLPDPTTGKVRVCMCVRVRVCACACVHEHIPKTCS